MKKIILFVCLIFTTTLSFATPKIIKYSPAIAPYVNFLATHQTNPVDYVMHLFDKYDIVIIAERDHRETTQWDFIYDLVSDPRFINRVGNMFTEYGSVYLQPQLEAFFNADQLDTQAIINMMHNFMPAEEGWDHNNFYNFLIKLYQLNKTLTNAQKIHLYFSDEPASWDGLTTKYRYQIFYGMPGAGDFINPRDRIMAMRIYTKLQDIMNSTAQRKKALVIMNSRHGFGYIKQLVQYKDIKNYIYIGQNTGGYLMKWLPDKVANIMMNTMGMGHGGTEQLIQQGKWDAAFLVMGNKPTGFDFANSPFGEDIFDYGQIPSTWGKYQDIFTGMIFYAPLKDHELYLNIPNFYDPAYKKLVIQRALIACDKDCAQRVQELKQLWLEMKLDPEKFHQRLYSDDVLAPIYQWITVQQDP